MIINGYIINSYNIGDTSIELTVFTLENGLMRLLYKGGRSQKKQALIQYFQPLWLDYNERYGRCYVRNLEHGSLAHIIPNISLSSAWYVNELLYVTQLPGEEDPLLYKAYVMALKSMSQAIDRYSLERSLRRFELSLLQSMGQDLILTHTYDGLQIQLAQKYTFFPGEGFYLTESGIEGKYILDFAKNNLDNTTSLIYLKNIMRTAIDHALDGRVLKTRSLGRILIPMGSV